MERGFHQRLRAAFPVFAAKLGDGSAHELEHVAPPASDEDIADLERSLGIPLPVSYKTFLRCARGFWLLGGVVQFGVGHPFFHDFEPWEKLTPPRQERIRLAGGDWPPPSHGMLCFAEFFLEADGDQVLFDVSRGLIDGEYPVVYYAHEDQPWPTSVLAQAFPEFLEAFLDYSNFAREDE